MSCVFVESKDSNWLRQLHSQLILIDMSGAIEDLAENAISMIYFDCFQQIDLKTSYMVRYHLIPIRTLNWVGTLSTSRPTAKTDLTKGC